MIPPRTELIYHFGERDSLEQFLTKSLTTVELDCEAVASTLKVIETILALEVNQEEAVLEEVKKTPDGLVLKELLKGIKYTFLGKNGTKPKIFSSVLDRGMEAKLLNILEKNLEDFSWSINDIKGISPSICMHKILMEEEHGPSIEHQRRLNPIMKEVVKNEVLKWLHAEFIYAISDSPWLSY